MRFFEDEEIRGVNLQLVCDYLSAIAPSSIETERAFSATKRICTEIRFILNEHTTDCLRFLRDYYTVFGQAVRKLNRLTPNDPYMGRIAPLTSKRSISYIYSTNIGTEYFKHALYSPFFLFKMQFVS